MTFLSIGITVDVAHVLGLILVFLCYFDGIDPGSLKKASPPIFLIFFGGLGLRLISGKRVMRLSLFFVLAESLIAILLIGMFLVLFDQQAMAFWAFGIDFPNVEG